MVFTSNDGRRQVATYSVDYTKTLTPISRGSDGLPLGLINRSELESDVAQLEAAYQAADTAILDLINNLSAGMTPEQVQALINQAISGVFHLRGEAAGDASSPSVATGTTNWSAGDTYRITSGGDTAFGFPTSPGDLVWYDASGTWRKIDNVDPSVTASADSPVEVSRLGDNQYQVGLKASFLQRIADIEAAIATHTSQIADLQNSDSTQNSRLDSAETTISNLQGTVTNLQTITTALQSAVAQIQAVNTQQDAAIASVQSTLQQQATQIAAVESDVDGLQSDIADIQVVNAQQDAAIAERTTVAQVTQAVTQALSNFWQSKFPKYPLSAFTKSVTNEVVDGVNSVVTTFTGSSGIGDRHFTMSLNQGDTPHVQGITYMGATGVGDNFIVKFTKVPSPSDDGTIPDNVEVSFVAQHWYSSLPNAQTPPAATDSVSPATVSISANTAFTVSANGLTHPQTGAALADEYIVLKLRRIDTNEEAWNTPVMMSSGAISYNGQASTLPLGTYRLVLEFTSGSLIRVINNTFQVLS